MFFEKIYPFKISIYLQHISVLQETSWSESPSHFRPRAEGRGLVHVRDLDVIPVPQVTLQVDHESHDAQPPSEN